MNTRPVVPTLAAAPTKNQRLGQFCAASSERRVSSFADEYVANGHRRILLLCRTAKYRKKPPICSWFVLNSDRLLASVHRRQAATARFHGGRRQPGPVGRRDHDHVAVGEEVGGCIEVAAVIDVAEPVASLVQPEGEPVRVGKDGQVAGTEGHSGLLRG